MIIMSTNRVYVKLRETYDLSTKENQLGVIGIHTPTGLNLTDQFAGLMQNFKFMRFNSVNVTIACASLMPLDPLQVGLEAGEVNPQDIFNPILYTAVSNDSFGRIQSMIRGGTLTTLGGSAKWNDNATSGVPDANALDVYYALLSTDMFATSMPQQGIRMEGVRPFCHALVTDKAVSGRANGSINAYVRGESSYALPGEDGNGEQSIIAYSAGCVPMPRIPTMYAKTGSAGSAASQQPGNVFDFNIAYNPVYCGMVIMPPAVLQKLYFRMTVEWSITFEEYTPFWNWKGLERIAGVGASTHKSDYLTQSASMTSVASSVDVGDMDLDPIMVSSA